MIQKEKKLEHGKTCHYCKLSQICLPKGLVENEIAQLDEIIEQSYELKANEVLSEPQQPFHYLYAIKSGSFKEYEINKNGEEQVIDFYLPGEIIGLDAICHNQYNYPAIALEDSQVCRIKFEHLLKLTERNPGLQQRLLNLISEKLLYRSLINKHQNAEQKLAAFLIDLSKRYASHGQNSNSYKLSMSRYDIGNYLDLTTETVSRIMTKFKNQELITADKKFITLNKPCELMAMLG
jgi:CRP/FNR family transcriptional regulator